VPEGPVQEDLQLALLLLPRGQCQQVPLARQLPVLGIILILYVDGLGEAETAAATVMLQDIHVGEGESHVLPRYRPVLIVVIPMKCL